LRAPDYIWAFAGPVLLIIIANSVFLVLAIRSVKRGFDSVSAAVDKRKIL
jgi:hypothetical protein